MIVFIFNSTQRSKLGADTEFSRLRLWCHDGRSTYSADGSAAIGLSLTNPIANLSGLLFRPERRRDEAQELFGAAEHHRYNVLASPDMGRLRQCAGGACLIYCMCGMLTPTLAAPVALAIPMDSLVKQTRSTQYRRDVTTEGRRSRSWPGGTVQAPARLQLRGTRIGSGLIAIQRDSSNRRQPMQRSTPTRARTQRSLNPAT